MHSEEPVLYRRLLATELFELLDTDADGIIDIAEWAALVETAPDNVQRDFAPLAGAWPLVLSQSWKSSQSWSHGCTQPQRISLAEWMGALDRPDLKCLSDAEYEYRNLALQVHVAPRNQFTRRSI